MVIQTDSPVIIEAIFTHDRVSTTEPAKAGTTWIWRFFTATYPCLPKSVPVFSKTDKVPCVSQLSQHRIILIYAFTPIIVQQIAFLHYFYTYQLSARHQGYTVRKLGLQVGYFDGDKHERDNSPVEVFGSLSWWIWGFLNITLYSVTLDLWYYLVHRAAREVWDMVGAPVLAYTTLRYLNIPFDFFMLWICLHYIVYTGISSHSGLRILMFPLTLSPLLSYFNAELSIEDHDLYHRYCWRIAKNYGKQTRLWDRVFGTCSVRLESNASNIDYKNRIEVPFY
ncbi:hypothetical protein NOF04DRAFT_1349186 [Fusarium oxysporum II5]|nr:hypothetical protein NOF04DRAFT_1349186 [Fusarium oxysporum II5]